MNLRTRICLGTASLYLCAVSVVSAQSVHNWSDSFGSSVAAAGNSITVDSQDNVIMTGQMNSGVNFGGGALSYVGNGDTFVTKFDSEGAHIWSKSFGNSLQDFGRAITTDNNDNVWVLGLFLGSIDFGGGTLTSNGQVDIYLLKLDENGNHLFSTSYGGTSFEYGYGICADPTGNIYFTGQYQGTIDFSGAGQSLMAVGVDGFVVKINNAGAHVWSEGISSAASDYGRDVTTDAAGNVFVTGDYGDDINLGGGVISAFDVENDIFIVKYDTNGNHVWSKGFGSGVDDDRGYGLATDSSGNVCITGYMTGAINFGGGLTGNGNPNMGFAAAFSNAGAFQWSRVVPSDGSSGWPTITSDVAGSFTIADLAFAPYQVDSLGNEVWSNSTTGAYFRSVASTSTGDIVGTGKIISNADLGGGVLPASSIFVVSFESPRSNTNLFDVWVDFGAVGAQSGTPSQPYQVFSTAVSAIPGGGGAIYVRGNSPGAGSTWTGQITKPIILKKYDSGTAIIGQ